MLIRLALATILTVLFVDDRSVRAQEPRALIPELGNESADLTLANLNLLSARTDFKPFSEYSAASLAGNGSLLGGLFDLETGQHTTGQVKDLLADGASILALCSKIASSRTESLSAFVSINGLSCLSFSTGRTIQPPSLLPVTRPIHISRHHKSVSS